MAERGRQHSCVYKCQAVNVIGNSTVNAIQIVTVYCIGLLYCIHPTQGTPRNGRNANATDSIIDIEHLLLSSDRKLFRSVNIVSIVYSLHARIMILNFDPRVMTLTTYI